MQSESILRHQIEAVYSKNMEELREQFRELHGFDCGDTNCRNLRRRIIYRLQEIYYGGIDTVDMEILNDIADKDPIANLKNVSAKRVSRVAGTKLYRIWKGRQHEVSFGKNGKFIYNGEAFKSLSAVAFRITGTKWNGKTFFGVR
jgi:hypothetical protein